MDRSEYVKINIDDISAKFIEEYDPLAFTHNGWVYFEIVIGCYDLPQSGNLAKDLFYTRLKKVGFFVITRGIPVGKIVVSKIISNYSIFF